MMEARRSQQDHDRMVARVARLLEEAGHTEVRADLPGFERPLPVPAAFGGDEVPDVTSLGRGRLIAEVETPDTLADAHAERQWRVFSMYAAENACRFCLVVPTGAEMVANERLRELGISAEIWPLPLSDDSP